MIASLEYVSKCAVLNIKQKKFFLKIECYFSPGFETESPYEQWLRHGGPERKYSEFYQFHHGQKKHQYRPPPFTKIDPRQKYKVLAGVCALLAIGIIGHVFAIT